MPTSSAGSTVAAASAAGGWLHTSGSRIVDADDQGYQVKAVSWFGLETANCAPHGLWQISLDSGMAKIAGFGFNTIRVPFSNGCLDQPATSIDDRLNPSLAGRTGLEVMDAVVASAKSHGLKVILDRHRPDTGQQSELWYTPGVSEQQWISDWTMLAERYADDPTVIGVDLHNEPHGAACWGCGDPARDWAAAATRAGNAVLAANPNLLIVVEGVEKSADGGSTWWGGSLADARAHPITFAVPGRLVYSPHDYPASIFAQTWFADPTYPANLPAVWDRNWGYLQKDGVAPVLLGEFGSTLATESDRQWLSTLVDYLHTNDMSFAFWSFNPNSGDTGGLVKDDWTTPQDAKLAALGPLLGAPAAGQSPSARVATGPHAVRPPLSAPAPATAPPAAAPPAPPPGAPAGGSAIQATWSVQSEWAGGYVAEFTVTATDAAVDSWTISWPDPAARGVANAWGMSCVVDPGTIRCVAADWAREVPAGQTIRVGVQVDSDAAAPTQPPLSVG